MTACTCTEEWRAACWTANGPTPHRNGCPLAMVYGVDCGHDTAEDAKRSTVRQLQRHASDPGQVGAIARSALADLERASGATACTCTDGHCTACCREKFSEDERARDRAAEVVADAILGEPTPWGDLPGNPVADVLLQIDRVMQETPGPGAKYEMYPLCCERPMRRSGLGGNSWICSKCEVYQGPLGARTPEQWWCRVEDGWSAWQLAQGEAYGVVPVPARVEVVSPTQRPAPVVHFDRDLTPDEADAIIAEFERRGTARGAPLASGESVATTDGARPFVPGEFEGKMVHCPACGRFWTHQGAGVPVHQGECDPPAELAYQRSILERIAPATRQHAEVVATGRLVDFEPPPRPDGFAQSAIDAAKAVLLSVGTGEAKK